MTRLSNLRIGQRLGLAFGFVITLLVALTLIGMYEVWKIDSALRDINEVNSVKQRYAINFRGSVHDRAIELRDVVLVDDDATVAAAAAAIDRLAADYERSAGPLDRMMGEGADAQEREILASIKAVEAATLPLIGRVRELRAAGEREQARALLLAEAKPRFIDWLREINRFIDLQESRNKLLAADAMATARDFAILMLVLCGIALAAGSAVAVAITRSVTRPLDQATRIARDIAKGDLDGRVDVTGRDELAALLGSMRDMQAELQAFAAAQGEIARQHEAGMTGFRIDAARFPGAYGRMARDVNDLVAAQIHVTSGLASLIGEYAQGDFGRDMVRLPGEQEAITAAADAAKAQMRAVNEQIGLLVDAAVAGDFSRRGDAARFDFVYRDMIDGLNTLMASAERGLDEVGTLLARVADGDLGSRADGDLPGRFGRLAADANRTVEQLARVVGGIRASAETIEGAAAEIANGNRDLAQRTDQQATSLEATASSLEELTATVRQNADNARQARGLAAGAAEVATRGGEVVGRVVTTMGEINDASRRVGEIVSVIDGIAFQTNILALNAAVEAARAGEQGRGFAVVASEVRSLAQRCAGAAREIRQLIVDSTTRVEEGTALVDRAGSTMAEIVTSVHRVTDIVADIAAASAEQSAGIEQVNIAVTRMDEGTQQNGVLVEQASAAAASLEQQAEQLVQAVSAFRHGASPRSAAGTAPRPAVEPAPALA